MTSVLRIHSERLKNKLTESCYSYHLNSVNLCYFYENVATFSAQKAYHTSPTTVKGVPTGSTRSILFTPSIFKSNHQLMNFTKIHKSMVIHERICEWLVRVVSCNSLCSTLTTLIKNGVGLLLVKIIGQSQSYLQNFFRHKSYENTNYNLQQTAVIW